jgi:transposase
MAHLYETGGMRRVHLKGRDNTLKRLLVHAGGFNLALIMRKLVGIGKPRQLPGAFACIFAWFGLLLLYAWSLFQTGLGFNTAQQEPAVTF